MAGKTKVLVIGPSTTASKGGMASVILQGMEDISKLDPYFRCAITNGF